MTQISELWDRVGFPVPYVGHYLWDLDQHTLDDPKQRGEVDSDQWAIEGSDQRTISVRQATWICLR
jgi:hypothetical protein